jgi:uncharacterized membrane protein YcaP (DUF421 family)
MPVLHSMWSLAQPWWEFVLRAAIVYVFLLVILRLTGRRQAGQLAPFDLVLLLVLSNAVQNAMNAGDNTVGAGLILAGTLIALNWGVGTLTARNATAERIIEGEPQILILDGKIYRDALRREEMSDLELKAALRQAGCESAEDVRIAVLENNGAISVIRRERPAS